MAALKATPLIGGDEKGQNIDIKPNDTSTDGSQYYAAGKMQVYGTVVTGVGQLYPALIFGRDGRGQPRFVVYNGKLVIATNNPEPDVYYVPVLGDLVVRNIEVQGQIIQPTVAPLPTGELKTFATMAEAKSKGKLVKNDYFKTKTGTVKQIP